MTHVILAPNTGKSLGDSHIYSNIFDQVTPIGEIVMSVEEDDPVVSEVFSIITWFSVNLCYR